MHSTLKRMMQKISKEMIEDMIRFNGVGLASNQVGYNGRIFVMGEENHLQ